MLKENPVRLHCTIGNVAREVGMVDSSGVGLAWFYGADVRHDPRALTGVTDQMGIDVGGCPPVPFNVMWAWLVLVDAHFVCSWLVV